MLSSIRPLAAFIILALALNLFLPAAAFAQSPEYGSDHFNRIVAEGWGTSEFAGNPQWVNAGISEDAYTTGSTAVLLDGGEQVVTLPPIQQPLSFLTNFRFVGASNTTDHEHGFYIWGNTDGDYPFDGGIAQERVGGSDYGYMYIYSEAGGYIDTSATWEPLTIGEWYSMRIVTSQDGISATLWGMGDTEPDPQLTLSGAIPISGNDNFDLTISSATNMGGNGYTEFESIIISDATTFMPGIPGGANDTGNTRVEVTPAITVTAPALLHFGNGIPTDTLNLPASVVNVETNNATGYTLEADWTELIGASAAEVIAETAVTLTLDGGVSTFANERTDDGGTDHALAGSITLPFVASDTYSGTATFTATTQ